MSCILILIEDLDLPKPVICKRYAIGFLKQYFPIASACAPKRRLMM
jgi:hypothetical protein